MNTLALHAIPKVFKYELRDVIRSRWLIGYTLTFLILTEVLFRFGGGSAQVLLSLSNAVLILIPLVCIVFGTMYLYNAREFIELMLTQPVRRKQLYYGLYLGLATPLGLGFAAGVSLPLLWHRIEATAHYQTLAFLLLAGLLLTAVFSALAVYIAVACKDRVKGLGVAVLTWLFFSIFFDGIVLGVVHTFSHYPLEKPMLILSALNPVGLARVFLLLNFDIAALMGYTGALFKQVFGSGWGVFLTIGLLLVWAGVPLYLGQRKFKKLDY